MLATKITKTQKAFLYLISIITGLLMLVYTPKQAQSGELPNFELVRQDDTKIVNYEKDFKNKPSIIHFWASWCATCIPEMVKYAEIQNEYPENLYVIGVNRRGSAALSLAFTESLEISGNMNFLIDKDDALYRAVLGRKMPLTLFVDTNGHYTVLEGTQKKEAIVAKINEILLTQKK